MKIIFSMALLLAATSFATTTIDPLYNNAYGANIGWVNAAGDTAHGAVIGQAFCSGYMYSANCGWISLGDGSPANGRVYSNKSGGDFGVNHDGHGHLTGYAYGANIGWINFEQTHGQPKVNLMTGNLSGYVWGANVGWISLAQGKSRVRTRSLAIIDTDADGISDAWEYGYTNVLSALQGGVADADGDGVSDLDEYLADTDPLSADDYLSITDFQTLETTNWVTWPVKTTRRYALEYTTALSNGTHWVRGNSFIPPSSADVTEEVPDAIDSTRFYRVQATPPLSE